MKGFNGYNRDIFTDLYPLGLGHRFFSTTLLRFTSPDKLSPFGQGGINSYCYCQGDPVNLSDPEGTFISRLLKYIGTATKRRKINLHSEKNALIDASRSFNREKAIVAFQDRYKKSETFQPGPKQLSERERHFLFYTSEFYDGRRWSYSKDPLLTTSQVEYLNETWNELPEKSEPGKISEWRGQ
jgi:RHS repeat-associated protein